MSHPTIWANDDLYWTPWPTPETYFLHETCPTCKAAQGETCQSRNGKFHTTRTDKGRYMNDVGQAPFSSDRIPFVRYDSLGDFWQPGIEEVLVRAYSRD